jgi:hypothetical protein
MAQFESGLRKMPVYASNCERSTRVEVLLEDGRTAMRYSNNQYYNSGNTNELFIAYLWGYSFGKWAGREEARE